MANNVEQVASHPALEAVANGDEYFTDGSSYSVEEVEPAPDEAQRREDFVVPSVSTSSTPGPSATDRLLRNRQPPSHRSRPPGIARPLTKRGPPTPRTGLLQGIKQWWGQAAIDGAVRPQVANAEENPLSPAQRATRYVSRLFRREIEGRPVATRDPRLHRRSAPMPILPSAINSVPHIRPSMPPPAPPSTPAPRNRRTNATQAPTEEAVPVVSTVPSSGEPNVVSQSVKLQVQSGVNNQRVHNEEQVRVVVDNKKDNPEETSRAEDRTGSSLPVEHDTATEGGRRVSYRELFRQWNQLPSRELHERDQTNSCSLGARSRSLVDREDQRNVSRHSSRIRGTRRDSTRASQGHPASRNLTHRQSDVMGSRNQTTTNLLPRSSLPMPRSKLSGMASFQIPEHQQIPRASSRPPPLIDLRAHVRSLTERHQDESTSYGYRRHRDLTPPPFDQRTMEGLRKMERIRQEVKMQTESVMKRKRYSLEVPAEPAKRRRVGGYFPLPETQDELNESVTPARKALLRATTYAKIRDGVPLSEALPKDRPVYTAYGLGPRKPRPSTDAGDAANKAGNVISPSADRKTSGANESESAVVANDAAAIKPQIKTGLSFGAQTEKEVVAPLADTRGSRNESGVLEKVGGARTAVAETLLETNVGAPAAVPGSEPIKTEIGSHSFGGTGVAQASGAVVGNDVQGGLLKDSKSVLGIVDTKTDGKSSDIPTPSSHAPSNPISSNSSKTGSNLLLPPGTNPLVIQSNPSFSNAFPKASNIGSVDAAQAAETKEVISIEASHVKTRSADSAVKQTVTVSVKEKTPSPFGSHMAGSQPRNETTSLSPFGALPATAFGNSQMKAQSKAINGEPFGAVKRGIAEVSEDDDRVRKSASPFSFGSSRDGTQSKMSGPDDSANNKKQENIFGKASSAGFVFGAGATNSKGAVSASQPASGPTAAQFVDLTGKGGEDVKNEDDEIEKESTSGQPNPFVHNVTNNNNDQDKSDEKSAVDDEKKTSGKFGESVVSAALPFTSESSSFQMTPISSGPSGFDSTPVFGQSKSNEAKSVNDNEKLDSPGEKEDEKGTSEDADPMTAATPLNNDTGGTSFGESESQGQLASSQPMFSSTGIDTVGKSSDGPFGNAHFSTSNTLPQNMSTFVFGAGVKRSSTETQSAPTASSGALVSNPPFSFGASAPSFGSSAPAFPSSGPLFSSSAPADSVPTSTAPILGSGLINFGATAPEVNSSAPAFSSSASVFGTGAPSFGATAPTFGTTAPTFGESTASAFGSTGAPSFGASSSGFGSTAPAFGATSLSFGSASSAFGSSTPGPGAPGLAFGATAPVFGTTAPAFGATAPAFGATAPPAFGATAPAFGATAPSFGSTTPGFNPAPVFGSTAPSFGTGAPFGTTGPGFGNAAFGAPGASAPAFGAGNSFNAAGGQNGDAFNVGASAPSRRRYQRSRRMLNNRP